jgi:hypothetical protein
MIGFIIRKSCLPFQILLDMLIHIRRRRLMMSYALKLTLSRKDCALVRG